MIKKTVAFILLTIVLLCPSAKAETGIIQSILHPGTWQFHNKFSLLDPSKWPIIPVPEIATDPNSGVTVGILPVLLATNGQHEITAIVAPDINTNTALGPGGTFRYLAYPSEDTQWYFTAGMQEKIAQQVDFEYKTGLTRENWWSFTARFKYERDPTDRFYGVGNNSRLGNETNYTEEQVYGRATFGINFTPSLQLSYTLKPRYVRISDGAYTSVPTISQLFPDQKGINGGTSVLNTLMFSYDTRDSVEIPRSGSLFRVFAGIADRSFLSSVSYTRLGAEMRHYDPLSSKITLASHLFLEYQPAGNELPFWSMADLGGESTSIWGNQMTLRGYGSGRFVDNNVALGNVEMRTRVYNMNIFGTHGILELAPFLDIGRVAHNLDFNPFSGLHPVGGIGFRGIAAPSVVGYVDVGYGGEGVAIFTGINYPF